MRPPPRGHSLVELLVAIPIVGTALLASGAGLAFGIRASQRGIVRGRMAVTMASRVEQLAAAAERSGPTCEALRDGSEAVDGTTVEWTVGSAETPERSVIVRARTMLRGVRLEDSIAARLRCAR